MKQERNKGIWPGQFHRRPDHRTDSGKGNCRTRNYQMVRRQPKLPHRAGRRV